MAAPPHAAQKAPQRGRGSKIQPGERPVTWMDVLAEKEADFAPVAPVSWTDAATDTYQKTSPKREKKAPKELKESVDLGIFRVHATRHRASTADQNSLALPTPHKRNSKIPLMKKQPSGPIPDAPAPASATNGALRRSRSLSCADLDYELESTPPMLLVMGSNVTEPSSGSPPPNVPKLAIPASHSTGESFSTPKNISPTSELSSHTKLDRKTLKKKLKELKSAAKEAPRGPLALYRATQAFDPQLIGAGYLAFNAGDIINVTLKQPDNLWLGSIGTRMGLFPAALVEEISAAIDYTPLAQLMRQSDWVLLKAIADAVPYEDSEQFTLTIFKLLDRNGFMAGVLEVLIGERTASASDPSALFRDSSFTSSLLAIYGRRVGRAYLQQVLEPVVSWQVHFGKPILVHESDIRYLRPKHTSPPTPSPFSVPIAAEAEKSQGGSSVVVMEPIAGGGGGDQPVKDVIPHLPHPGESEDDALRRFTTEHRIRNLKEAASKMLRSLIESFDLIPLELRNACLLLKNAVAKKFPGFETKLVGGFFFLRIVCPTIISPEDLGIKNPMQIPDERRQELVTLSRVLQAIANGFPPRNMGYLSEFIEEQIPVVKQFLEKLATTPRVASYAFELQRATTVHEQWELSMQDQTAVAQLHFILAHHRGEIETELAKLDSWKSLPFDGMAELARVMEFLPKYPDEKSYGAGPEEGGVTTERKGGSNIQQGRAGPGRPRRLSLIEIFRKPDTPKSDA